MQKKTLLDLIADEHPSFLDDKVLSRVLRYELNCYFTSRLASTDHNVLYVQLHLLIEYSNFKCVPRQVAPDAIIHSSEELIENASNPHDVVLGMLGRAIGYYWGDYDEVLFANDMIQDALLYAENEFSNVNLILVNFFLSFPQVLTVHGKYLFVTGN